MGLVLIGHSASNLTQGVTFDKLLRKQCPWHPHSKHSGFECYQLRKSLSAPPLDKGDRSKKDDKDDDETTNKGDPTRFLDISKTVNIIFGGESRFV